MFSLLIKNAKVIDGVAEEPRSLDVAVQGDQIVNVAPKIEAPAEQVIDATSKTLTPGFIDLQNHSDSYWEIFDNPSLDSLIAQGFTTILVGNCGASLAPLLTRDALLAMQKWHNLDGVNVNWQSFSEFVEELSRKRLACNLASLVGYSTLRRAVVGDQVRSLQKNEMTALKRVLEESLDAGAFGLSNGLSYAHEIIISELELFELAKIVKDKSAMFSVHLRNEGAEVIEALEEALDIARNTEINLKISHLKIRGQTNWDKFDHLTNLIDTAFHQGVNVHFDLYPYEIMWQPLYSYLPKWSMEGGRSGMIQQFQNQTQRRKILDYLSSSGIRFSEMRVASTATQLNFAGKTMGQIAKNLETTSEEAILHLIENGGSEVMVFENNLDPKQVNELAIHPLSFIGTDGGGFSLNEHSKLVHPRCFGTAPKFLRSVVNGNGLTMTQAIKKLTSGPAKKAGIKKRGEIKVGNFADLVVFDENTITDKATYENPYQFNRGIDHVFVNGKEVFADNQPTGKLPGYVLRKS